MGLVLVVHETPKVCPSCTSTKLAFSTAITNKGQTYICGFCGNHIVVQTDEEEDVGASVITASFVSCSHCGELGRIQESGGYEWCSNCGLDPGEPQDSNDLSHLWKAGSTLRSAMERGTKSLRPGKDKGRFLRLHCGPHCSYAKDCPQSLGNFKRCYKEWKSEGEESGEVVDLSRRRHREKHKKHHQQNKAKNPFVHEPHKAKFMCARGGLFEKSVYGNQDTKSSGNTRSG